MRHTPMRKYLALCLAVIILALSLSGFCRGSHGAELSAGLHAAQTAGCPDLSGDGCPCCPADDHSTPGGCLTCDCSCHAPLLVHPFTIAFLQLIAPLEFHESFTYLPEVYLSKFIPPQNLA